MKKQLPCICAAVCAFLAVYWPGPQPNESPAVVLFAAFLGAACAWGLMLVILRILKKD